jgi:hypothetical protein
MNIIERLLHYFGTNRFNEKHGINAEFDFVFFFFLVQPNVLQNMIKIFMSHEILNLILCRGDGNVLTYMPATPMSDPEGRAFLPKN